jgi:hypothetical protein
MSEKKTPQKVITETEKEMMYTMYRNGATLKAISEEFDLAYVTLKKYKREGGWDERKEIEIAKETKLMEIGPETLAQESYTKVLRACFVLAEQAEQRVLKNGEDINPNLLKLLTDCIDKLQRLHLFSKAGGVNKSESRNLNVNTKVDYREMAKIYKEAKKNGEEYDSKKHLEDVINATYEDNDG